MKQCHICGKPAADDLFSAVTGEDVCSICKLRFIGGLPTTGERVKEARTRLGLADGDFLSQDNAAEARRILGRS